MARLDERRGGVGRPEGRNYLNDPGVDGRTILKWILKKWGGWGNIDWIFLAQDKDRW